MDFLFSHLKIVASSIFYYVTGRVQKVRTYHNPVFILSSKLLSHVLK